MAQILIRNIPDDIVETYKTKAQLAGKSLEQYLRDFIAQHVPYTAEERMALTRRYLEASGGPFEPLTKEEMREGAE